MLSIDRFASEQAVQLADQVGQLALVLFEFAGLFLDGRHLHAKTR